MITLKTSGNEAHPVTVYPANEPMRREMASSYADIRKLLDGGYVEVAENNGRLCVICDEEGRIKDLPQNVHFEGYVGTVIIAPIGLLGPISF